jgi:16S rRNA (cytidine1402-2'-O)-methyltransferase
MAAAQHKGILYLLPVPLAPGDPGKSLPAFNLRLIRELDLFVVENIRTARRFLRQFGYTASLDEDHFLILDKHSQATALPSLLNPLLEGRNAGLMSESGTPCIADPGASLVAAAQMAGITVRPLSGPSSLILGLMASGLNGQSFRFHGYLPVQSAPLKQSLKLLEKEAFQEISQVFIEAPYRNQKLLDEILQTCHPDLMLCIASEISGEKEFIRTRSIAVWRQRPPDIHKKNTLFILGRLV